MLAAVVQIQFNMLNQNLFFFIWLILFAKQASPKSVFVVFGLFFLERFGFRIFIWKLNFYVFLDIGWFEVFTWLWQLFEALFLYILFFAILVLLFYLLEILLGLEVWFQIMASPCHSSYTLNIVFVGHHHLPWFFGASFFNKADLRLTWAGVIIILLLISFNAFLISIFIIWKGHTFLILKNKMKKWKFIFGK